jgi:hypothetical protein
MTPVARSVARVDDRLADLKQIHALQREIGLSADDASALKLTLTGVASSGDMSAPQRAKLLAHLRGLALRAGPKAGKARRSVHKRAAWNPKHKLVWALWQQLADAGKVTDRRAGALGAYVKRQTGVDQLAWINERQIDLVIESLKKWLARAA